MISEQCVSGVADFGRRPKIQQFQLRDQRKGLARRINVYRRGLKLAINPPTSVMGYSCNICTYINVSLRRLIRMSE